MTEDKREDKEPKRSVREDLGDVEGDLLGLECLLRVIQDSAEFTSMRYARNENPTTVLEDIENSLDIAINRLREIIADLQDVGTRVTAGETATA